MKLKTFFLAAVPALFPGPDARSVELRAKLEPLLEAHCYDCHDADTHKGGLDLTRLPLDFQIGDNLQKWTKVFDKVAHGEMPPKKKPRPAPALAAEFLQTLRTELHGISLARQQREGRAVRRRLSRTEYLNTLWDLLGVEGCLRELLPEDETDGGFENIGSALNLSEVHLERYLQAADLALREATVRTARPEPKKSGPTTPSSGRVRFSSTKKPRFGRSHRRVFSLCAWPRGGWSFRTPGFPRCPTRSTGSGCVFGR